MGLYLVLSKFSGGGLGSMIENREALEKFRRMLEEAGVKVVEQYIVFGEWDFMAIVEAGDERALAAALLRLNTRGGVKTSTYRIMRVEELLGQ